MPGESYGWRSLAGYSPWACKELDTTIACTNAIWKGSRASILHDLLLILTASLQAGLVGPFNSWGNWGSERWGKLPGSPWKLSWGGDLKCWSQSSRAFQATKGPVLCAPWEDLFSLGLCLTMSLGPALAGHWASACPSVQGAGGPDMPWGWWFWNHRGSGCSS